MFIWSVPSAFSGKYTEGMWFRLFAELEEPVRVEGSPRLALDIGGTIRHADFSPWVAHRISDPEHKKRSQVRRGFEVVPRFDYLIQADDLDTNGVSISADAFDFAEGSFTNEDGMDVTVEIAGVAPADFGMLAEPGLDLASHVVDGRPRPRVCTDERALALAYHGAVLPKEWDGTPFRFYFNLVDLPESERADAEEVLAVAQRMSERIENQLGYPVLEVAGWIEDPKLEFPGGCDSRSPGQIVAIVLPESDQRYVSASPRCALWASHGPDMNFGAGTVSHETFHLFGFAHHPRDWQRPGRTGEGVFMSTRLNGAYVDEEDTPLTFEDVDTLRCIFPND